MSQIFVKCVCSVLYAGEVRDSKLLALPVKKILQLENEKRNQNSQKRSFKKLSDSKLAKFLKFQPNWFTGCRLGV